MDALAIFNAFEAVFWMALGIFVAIAGHRIRGIDTRRRVLAALFLVAFGVSDIIEIQTGAFWRPLGLLVFKGVCLTGIVVCGARILLARKQPAAKDKDGH